MTAVIEVDKLTKRFGSLTAVDGISFSVQRGEFFAFLGPNGAGKTTTINILCTLARPTSGSVQVAGYDVIRQPHLVRQHIGIIFQDPALDTQLTAWENLSLHARVYAVPGPIWRARAEELLKLVELWERRHTIVRTFSGGMKRRLEIVRALLHQPEILFLDEPTLGLDPQTRRQIWEYLTALHQETGVTLFLTTHYLEEAEQCDRLAIIDHGRIIALDTPQQLKAQVSRDIIVLATADNERAVQELRRRFGLQPLLVDGTVRVEAEHGDTLIPELVRELSVPIHSISLRRPSLDDVFIALTGRQIRDEEASELDRFREHHRAYSRS